MINNTDYRNTDQCSLLTDIESKKRNLEKRIQQQHTRAKIMYKQINKKQGEYFIKFAEIYNNKCAYCGASRKFTDIRLFEVDHYVCEDAFPNDIEGHTEAGRVSNLVFSCYSCNRGKSNLYINSKYQPILNPDDNSISNIFSRDDQYYIRINKDYSEDELIQSFYIELSLGSEFRRLDYLLLEIDNLIAKVKESNKALADKLEICKGRLSQKKNFSIV